jgi:hypothetical protein
VILLEVIGSGGSVLMCAKGFIGCIAGGWMLVGG